MIRKMSELMAESENWHGPLSAAVWAAAFNPLETDTRPITVTLRLQQAIALGLLPDGEPLPNETDLAALMGVSKATLRSALATLRERGLLETRRGRAGGSFVRRRDQADGRFLLRQLQLRRIDDLRDLRDLHTAVAGAAAALAAERARGATLERLQASACLLAQTTATDQALRADFRFHIELAASTRSAQLTRVEMSVQSDIAPLLWIPGSEACSSEKAGFAHGAIMDAIAARDRTAARDLAENHVADSLNALIEMRMRMADDD
jgi:GntR family transcriptional regulator, transcriptional repressor for pyruvate dehydrogenase complex